MNLVVEKTVDSYMSLSGYLLLKSSTAYNLTEIHYYLSGYLQLKSSTAYNLTEIHYEFMPSMQGKREILVIDQHTFNMVSVDGRYWTCTRRTSAKCKSRVRFDSQKRIVLYDSEHNHPPRQLAKVHGKYIRFDLHFELSIKIQLTYELIPSSHGKHPVLMIDNHTFNKVTSDGRHWACSRKTSSKCKAKVRLDNQKIVLYEKEHNHPPRNLVKINGNTVACTSVYTFSLQNQLTYEFIPSTHGKHSVLKIDNHTFNQTTKDGRYWTCSRRTSTRCKARVRFDSTCEQIVLYDRIHNHEARKLVKIEGRYFKM
ncbi:hypothetical protein ABMA27_001313 [Loxostege sticticalis]|uniref:FLYWCH-type domain-containing protein n=1 Tax=Loxostege sticticalis TaxID=481309 RepID=A0ABR3HY07_LOXSC